MIGMGSRFQWFFDLTKSGVKQDTGDDFNRRILFSNIVFITLPIVYLIFMLIDFEPYLHPRSLKFDQFIVPIEIGICAFCIWLNAQKLTTLSRHVFLVSWPLLLQLIPIYLLDSPTDYTLAFPIGLIFHSILIQLMISHRNETRPFWVWLAVNFIVILLTTETLSYFDKDESLPKDIIYNSYYTLDCILYWLLFNLVAYYVILEMEKNIRKIHESNLLVARQRDELNKLNANLEKIVQERTRALEEQNAKLKNYAFYNAHLIRGPFCRIQGLINLEDMGEDREMIRSKLDICMEELDQRIHEIQKIVEQEGFQETFGNPKR